MTLKKREPRNPLGIGGWKKGQSGNPAGPPPKSRALTEILKRAGDKEIEHNDQKKTAKEFIAEAVTQGLTEKRVQFPNGEEIELSGGDWLALVQWWYRHIDGGANVEIDIEDPSAPVTVLYVNDWRSGSDDN